MRVAGLVNEEGVEMKSDEIVRKVINVIDPIYVMEGAGVRLRRSIATRQLDYLDPFLLFDHFGSHNPADYLAGFPMHPHRGIETVTYMKAGIVRHTDSMGNSGEITAGDVQWMTAGGGIMHEEMPRGVEGHMEGFQLWVNLPAKMKMITPRYQEIPARTIPLVTPEPGVNVKIITGEFNGVKGPVTEIAADPTYLDVMLAPGSDFSSTIEEAHTAFAYLYEGGADFGGTKVDATRLVVFGRGSKVQIKAGEGGTRFLLISGKPLGEPIARYGPFVMNTQDEIEQALRDLRNGTFVKNEPST
jgi:redox-sensitive bicupin YhaK (pirin superfamily)